jgi:hypothetical protein
LPPLRGDPRRRQDRDQLSRFPQQWPYLIHRRELGALNDFEPADTLVCLFEGNAQFRDELTFAGANPQESCRRVTHTAYPAAFRLMAILKWQDLQ